MKFYIISLILTSGLSFTTVKAEGISHKDESIKNEIVDLRKNQECLKKDLKKLSLKNKEFEEQILRNLNETKRFKHSMDSIQEICTKLDSNQKTDKFELVNSIDKTNELVKATENVLFSRTLWGIVIIIITLVFVIGLAYKLAKRIKSGSTSIDEVRKAQDALQVAQNRMQEESIKLDDKLLELFDRQIANAPKNVDNSKLDHSLALKVADEIVRIELNMTRMDPSIKGYKQLSKAVERIKDNFKANGYEIVDMLGKPYNEGMKVTADFVADEDLEDGAQIITGITKPQVNYNGQMIQAAQITVSQNI